MIIKITTTPPGGLEKTITYVGRLVREDVKTITIKSGNYTAVFHKPDVEIERINDEG